MSIESSVSVSAIPAVKAQIRGLSLAAARQLARQALACGPIREEDLQPPEELPYLVIIIGYSFGWCCVRLYELIDEALSAPPEETPVKEETAP